jgi:hypothetical protein
MLRTLDDGRMLLFSTVAPRQALAMSLSNTLSRDVWRYPIDPTLLLQRSPPTAHPTVGTFRVWRQVDPLKRILQRLQSSSKGSHIMSATQSIPSRNHWPELVEVDGLRTTWSPAELY